MKTKMIALALALMMALIPAAMAESTMLGGWSIPESNEVTEELKAVFDKGLEGLMGVNYEPVAYMGSQLVAGTNHCFLCKATVVYPDAEPYWVLVYLYQDLEGNVTITTFAQFDLEEMFDMSMMNDIIDEIPAEPTTAK